MLVALSFFLTFIQGPKLHPDTKRLFDWYDGLGDTKFLERPFVGVQSTFNDPMWSLVDTGFLMREDEKSFDILNVDHGIIKYTKVTKPGTYHHFEIIPLKFADVVKNSMAFDKDGNKADEEDQRAGKRRPLLIGSDFGSAWLCYKFGLYAESNAIIEPRRKWYEKVKKDNPKEFRDYYDFFKAGQRASVERIEHRAIDLFEDMSLTRADILPKFEELATKFASTQLGPDLAAICDRLKTMISEDKTHVIKNDSEQERIAELIWNIRNEGGIDLGAGRHDSIDKLVAIGMPVVPALIGALTDENFTRCHFHHRHGAFSYNTLGDIYTVKDGAKKALELIAHRDFRGETPEKLKEAVREWLSEIQGTSEQAILMKGVRKGDQDSSKQAAVLIQKYPKEALAALKDGYSACRVEHFRSQLVEQLRALPGQETTDFIRHVAMNDKDFEVRMVAVKLLIRRDVESGLQLAKMEWKALPKMDMFGFGINSLIDILYTSGQPEAVATLRRGLRSKSIEIRFTVMFSYQNAFFRLGLEDRSQSTSAPKLSQAYLDAVEDLFASELDDNKIWNGSSSSSSGELRSPKLSTVAIDALARLLPSAYRFVNTRSASEMERLRVEALKNYKKRRAKK